MIYNAPCITYMHHVAVNKHGLAAMCLHDFHTSVASSVARTQGNLWQLIWQNESGNMKTKFDLIKCALVLASRKSDKNMKKKRTKKYIQAGYN